MFLTVGKTYRGKEGFLKGLLFKCDTWEGYTGGTVTTFGSYARTFKVTPEQVGEADLVEERS